MHRQRAKIKATDDVHFEQMHQIEVKYQQNIIMRAKKNIKTLKKL